MEQRRANRRFIAILALGALICAVAFGVRLLHQKPIHGTWLGYSYLEIEGKKVADTQFGQYLIELRQNGTYKENGNSTSGTWVQKGNEITLTPTRFMDLTPQEHRSKYLKRDGKPNRTIERLLKNRMKAMLLSYQPSADRLIYIEPTLRFEYERER